MKGEPREGSAAPSAVPARFRLDADALRAAVADTPLGPWSDALIAAVLEASPRHGDLPTWRAALACLPDLTVRARTLDASVVAIEAATDDAVRASLHESLRALVPWRKGPFRIADVEIDCEWRSDWKWDRLVPHLAPLDGRLVLDVGCGSGYHLWRLRGAGAAFALGIDPGLLFACQFAAVQRYMQDPHVQCLPLTLDALPAPMAIFDTVLSMGVLYHRRDHEAHLVELLAALRPGGELVLETLISPSKTDDEHRLGERYARMRNVRALPSATRVTRWMGEAGFVDVRLISVDVTSTEEQRSTDWMPYRSLVDALDPADPDKTVEGHPRPHRAILLARRP